MSEWNTLEHHFQTLMIFIDSFVWDIMLHNHTMQVSQWLLFMYVLSSLFSQAYVITVFDLCYNQNL